MLKPIHTTHTTHVLKAPVDWDEEANGECIDLPSFYEDGVYYSLWALSDADRKLIAEGGNVLLGIYGKSHPPVSVNIAKKDSI